MFSLMGNCFTCMCRQKEPVRNITLVLVGLDNAGKTCIAKGLKGEVLHGDVAPTVGFSSLNFRWDRCNITVYDLGGGRRIRGIWKNYFSEVYGLIYVVDASDTDRIEEARVTLGEILENHGVSGKPVLILANKQDKDGALDEIDICESLALEQLVNVNKCPTRVETCSFMLGGGKKLDRSIKEGFRWLLETINADYELLMRRVEQETQTQREAEEHEKKLRLERVKKAREERKRNGSASSESVAEDDDKSNPFKPMDQAISKTKKKQKEVKKRGKNKVAPLAIATSPQKSPTAKGSEAVSADRIPNDKTPSDSDDDEEEDTKLRVSGENTPTAKKLSTATTTIDRNASSPSDSALGSTSQMQSVDKEVEKSSQNAVPQKPVVTPPVPMPRSAPLLARRNKSHDSGVEDDLKTAEGSSSVVVATIHELPRTLSSPVRNDDLSASGSSAELKRRKKKRRFKNSIKTAPPASSVAAAADSGGGDELEIGLSRVPLIKHSAQPAVLERNGLAPHAPLPALRAPPPPSPLRPVESSPLESDFAAKWGLVDELPDFAPPVTLMPNSEQHEVIT